MVNVATLARIPWESIASVDTSQGLDIQDTAGRTFGSTMYNRFPWTNAVLSRVGVQPNLRAKRAID
jgi:hypothetical protein